MRYPAGMISIHKLIYSEEQDGTRRQEIARKLKFWLKNVLSRKSDYPTTKIPYRQEQRRQEIQTVSTELCMLQSASTMARRDKLKDVSYPIIYDTACTKPLQLDSIHNK
jgi:hypothetical protein